MFIIVRWYNLYINASQKVYNKHDHRRYSTTRYIQALRNNVQVVIYTVYLSTTTSTAVAFDFPPTPNFNSSSYNSDYRASLPIIQWRYDTFLFFIFLFFVLPQLFHFFSTFFLVNTILPILYSFDFLTFCLLFYFLF